ncbi:hypothetical protein FZEAL_8555 [Fusarium zealandicum]|uniref:Necrosis inducing protein n=1 Tax=Fusarium zealandicum TaxID=1053134 RepID=A0A8H4XGR3_9HYPO|nr:hypothetical protein FZEAL_8555 [Fusarium zealandicum]
MQTKIFNAAAILSALAAVQASPAPIQRRSILPALPESADEIELKFQPKLDFDTDGCYNTAAIAADGNTNNGADQTGTPQGNCRDPHQLENSNVYSRARCNNGKCAIMYEYYFEKDQNANGIYGGGHRHDWENVVVFTEGDKIIRVAPSAHDGYVASNEFPTDGNSPLIVYHKDGIKNHCFRFANDADIGGVENFSGSFYRSPVIGWNHWPEGLRETLLKNFGGDDIPKPKLSDDKFGEFLAKAAGDQVPGFDPNVDG